MPHCFCECWNEEIQYTNNNVINDNEAGNVTQVDEPIYSQEILRIEYDY